MVRIYFHGNCQTRTMQRMMSELDGDVDVRGREIHNIKLPDEIDGYVRDIAWADVVVAQPISDTYRDEPRLSLRWVRQNVRADTRIVVFPSMYFRAYTPQVFYLRPLQAVGMPYHDALLVRAYLAGRLPGQAADELDDAGSLPDTLIRRELDSALRDLDHREQQSCDVRVSDVLRERHAENLLFHTPNHPSRLLHWIVLDRALEHVGVTQRPEVDGVDYLADLSIPPPRGVVASLGLRAGPEFADLCDYTHYRLPKRPPLPRRTYAAELWQHYDALGGAGALRPLLAAEAQMSAFLRRDEAARDAVTRPPARIAAKKNLGRPSKFIELPRVDSEEAWRATHDTRWEAIASRPRLAPAPIVDRNADMLFFLTKTHHKHQVGLWTYPSGTVFRARGRSVCFVPKAEGGILDSKGFYYGTQWLDQVASLPTEIVERVGPDVLVDPDVLTRPVAQSGEYVVCFDGNWRSYYHWLADSISRLFVLRKLSQGRVILPTAPENMLPFHLDSLRLLGVRDDQMVAAEPGRPFVKYQQLLWMLWNPTPWGGLGTQAEMGAAFRAAVGLDPGPGHRRIYITRRGGRRKVVQAEAVEAVMAELGFEVVLPDELDFAEQVRTFGQASWIVGPHGAGLTNIMFAPPGCTVVEFMPDVLCRPHYWGLATSLGQRYGMMVVPGASYFADLDVDPVRLRAFISTLDQAGQEFA